MRAHQRSGQKGGQQHPPLGRQGIHPRSIRGSEGIRAVQGQKGREEGGKLHRVSIEGHDDTLQHANSSLVGCADAQLVFTACTRQQTQVMHSAGPGEERVAWYEGGWGPHTKPVQPCENKVFMGNV